MKKYLTWDEYITDCANAAGVASNFGPFTAVLGVARGGLIPATIIAHKLGIKRVFSLGVTYYDGDIKRDAPIVYQQLPAEIEYENVLIVDEVLDTGETWEHVIKHELERCRCNNYHFLALYSKDLYDKFKLSSLKMIDIETWLVMPYENEQEC